jgi:hypothetical protein
VLAAFERAGLRPVKVVFWNSVFTSFVEHVLMKLGEALVGRRTKDEGRRTKNAGETPPSSVVHAPSSGAGTAREIRARRRLRGQLGRRGLVYYGLMAVTLLMELDLWLFGGLRSGSYFIVVEKPAHTVGAARSSEAMVDAQVPK